MEMNLKQAKFHEVPVVRRVYRQIVRTKAQQLFRFQNQVYFCNSVPLNIFLVQFY